MNIKNGLVFDVSGNRDAEGQNVIVYKAHEGLNQKWKIFYLDEKKAEPEKGLDENTGLYRNRLFYITSRLPDHRVITV